MLTGQLSLRRPVSLPGSFDALLSRDSMPTLVVGGEADRQPQGAPKALHSQARAPCQGPSGWFSQT